MLINGLYGLPWLLKIVTSLATANIMIPKQKQYKNTSNIAIYKSEHGHTCLFDSDEEKKFDHIDTWILLLG
jgi:hypothetical protein